METLHCEELLQHLFEVLSPEKLDEIARETRFTIRKRCITASDFISLLFHMHGNLVDNTLQELCTKLDLKQDVSISRAAIDKRFKPEAVAFLQRVIQEFILAQYQLDLSALSLADSWSFSSIRMIDSTAANVPDHLKKRAQKTQQESAKIQFEFDYLTGQVTYLHVDFQNRNDAKMGANRIPFINEDELCLQDLGYFNFEQFKKMEDNQEFFITKVRTDAYLAFQNPFPSYHSCGRVIQSSLYQKIDLVALCENLAPGEYLELEGVYFGRDAHFPARCIIFAHDEQRKERQVQKIVRRAVKSGKVPKQVVRNLAGITIYMTNLPESTSPHQVTEIYRLRWQIELSFKVWKSFLEIDHFKEVKKERWLCHLYGTLLISFISQLIAYQLRNTIWEQTAVEISEMIAIRIIAKDFLPDLYDQSREKEKTLKDLVLKVIKLLLKTAWKPRSTKGTAFKRLQSI